MLRHTGQKRSYRHNIRLAVLLCLNAGFINAAGYLAFKVLTTNVTGHAALLAVDLATGKYRSAGMVLLWLLLFLAGAFSSGFYISKKGMGKANVYVAPIIVIIMILTGVALFGRNYDGSLIKTERFAGCLLFGMGMQNAMVSMISGSVVRTTHLTGMFTDLGVDLAALIHCARAQRAAVKRRAVLRLVIIISFLAGGILGGFMFLQFSFSSFGIPVCILLIAMFYDYFRIRFTRIIGRRRFAKSINNGPGDQI